MVIFNHFSGDGQQAEPTMDPCDDPAVVALCASAFEAVWQRAIPHAEYHPG
jgi:hypothetical protein